MWLLIPPCCLPPLQVDLKDKWRNLVRAGKISEQEEKEIEVGVGVVACGAAPKQNFGRQGDGRLPNQSWRKRRLQRLLMAHPAHGVPPPCLQETEARLRQQLIGAAKRKPGRPPKFVSPSAKRRRAREDESDDDDDEDPVEDAGRAVLVHGSLPLLFCMPGCACPGSISLNYCLNGRCGLDSCCTLCFRHRHHVLLPRADAGATEDEDEAGESEQEEGRSEEDVEDEGAGTEEGAKQSNTRKGSTQQRKGQHKGGRGGGRGGRGGGRGSHGNGRGRGGKHEEHEHDEEEAPQQGDRQLAGPRRSGRKHH